jgi:hypothetical protein
MSNNIINFRKLLLNMVFDNRPKPKLNKRTNRGKQQLRPKLKNLQNKQHQQPLANPPANRPPPGGNLNRLETHVPSPRLNLRILLRRQNHPFPFAHHQLLNPLLTLDQHHQIMAHANIFGPRGEWHQGCYWLAEWVFVCF